MVLSLSEKEYFFFGEVGLSKFRVYILAGCFCGAGFAVSAESDILQSPTAKISTPAASLSDAAWTYSPSGESVRLLQNGSLANESTFSLEHSAFPSSSLDSSPSTSDHRLGVNYRANLSDFGFLESRSTIDDSEFGPYSQGYRQSIGYGLKILDRQSLTFNIVPGVVGDFSADRPIEERLKLMGNLNQNLSWEVSDGFIFTQNFNTTLERTETDDLSAVMNLDLETLFADRLSFKLSYEVHYDDSFGEDLEKRDSRLSTSVGFRF